MKKRHLLFFVIIITFLFLRLYQLPQRVNFSMEQGQILLKIREIWQTKKLTLVGLETSIKTKSGRGFFQGPWIYYLPLPFLLIGRWDPLSISYFLILLNLLALIIMFIGIKNIFGLRPAFLAALLFAITPKMVFFSQFIWNPNFLPPVSAVLIYFWLKTLKNKKVPLSTFFLIGITLGFGLSFHYQFLILILAFFLWMLIKKFPFRGFLTVLFGFIASFSPLIIFELRHNFYNLQTIFLILKEGGKEKISFPPPFHYYISLVPFIFLIFSCLLDKVIKRKRTIGAVVIAIYSLYCFLVLLSKPNSGYTMPKGWNYPAVKKTVGIISKENAQNFNIASLLSGDTRDYPTRYLLTVAQKPPLEVESYPESENLFVVSRHSQNETINNPVWEISSFCPCELTKTWSIQNGIKLYLLKKVR